MIPPIGRRRLKPLEGAAENFMSLINNEYPNDANILYKSYNCEWLNRKYPN
jgi:hypothetical protein